MPSEKILEGPGRQSVGYLTIKDFSPEVREIGEPLWVSPVNTRTSLMSTGAFELGSSRCVVAEIAFAASSAGPGSWMADNFRQAFASGSAPSTAEKVGVECNILSRHHRDLNCG